MSAITCPECGKDNAVGNTFCIGCGCNLSEATAKAEKQKGNGEVNVCPNCGKENKASSSFCIGCGTSLNASGVESAQGQDSQANVCPKCGKPYAEGDAFCIFCGNALSQAPVAPAATTVRPAVPRTASSKPTRQRGEALRENANIPIWLVIVAAVVILGLVGLLLFSVFKPGASTTSGQPSATNVAQTSSASSESVNSSASPSTSESSNTSASSAAGTASASSQSATTQSSEYVLPESNSRYYSRSELESLSTLDLYHARNEIYARHGRGFKNQDLRDFFATKTWYHETTSPEAFNEGVLNEYEKANTNLMLEIEQSRNSPYV